jgi:hypothetical protein
LTTTIRDTYPVSPGHTLVITNLDDVAEAGPLVVPRGFGGATVYGEM